MKINVQYYRPVDENGVPISFDSAEEKKYLEDVSQLGWHRTKRRWSEAPTTPLAELLSKAYFQGMTDVGLSL